MVSELQLATIRDEITKQTNLIEAYSKQLNEMIYNQNQMIYELMNLIKENNAKED